MLFKDPGFNILKPEDCQARHVECKSRIKKEIGRETVLWDRKSLLRVYQTSGTHTVNVNKNLHGAPLSCPPSRQLFSDCTCHSQGEMANAQHKALSEPTHLFDVVTRLGTGLYEHDAQLFSPLFAFLDCDLPVNEESFQSKHCRLEIIIHCLSGHKAKANFVILTFIKDKWMLQRDSLWSARLAAYYFRLWGYTRLG